MKKKIIGGILALVMLSSLTFAFGDDDSVNSLQSLWKLSGGVLSPTISSSTVALPGTTFTGTVTGTDAYFDNLTVSLELTNSSLGTGQVAYGSTGGLIVSEAGFEYDSATNTLSAGAFSGATATITTASITSAGIGSAAVTLAYIDTLTATGATVVTLTGTTATITNGTVTNLVIGAGTWIQDSDGNNIIYINATGGIELGGELQTGPFNLGNDSGTLRWVNKDCTDAAAGTDQSYSFAGDNGDIFTVYFECDGAGGTQYSGLQINQLSIYEPSTDTRVVTGSTITATNTIMRLSGSGSVTLSTTPTIADAGVDGTQLILQGISDAETFTIQDESNLAGSGLQLSGGNDFTFGSGDTLMLMYDSGEDAWLEISRSDN